MAKARFVPGRVVYGIAHRATRNARGKRRARSGSAELSVAGLGLWTLAFIVFFFLA